MTLTGGTVAQSVERMTPGEEIPDSILLWLPAPHWLGQCQYNVTGWDRSLGTRPQYSLVVEGNVEIPNIETNKDMIIVKKKKKKKIYIYIYIYYNIYMPH